jgi:pilus assembly protein CpaE
MVNFGPDESLAALLISPSRPIADEFTATTAVTHAFQIIADFRAYPSQNTLDIRLRQFRPDLVLLDVETDLETATGLISFLSSLNPPLPVVALHTQNVSQSVVATLRAGAFDYIASPFDVGLQRELVGRLKKVIKSDTTVSVKTGRVAVFTSAKPGTGSSTLATHTAHALCREDKRVLLIDLDLDGGTTAFNLKLATPHSILTAMENAADLDPSIWSQIVVNSSGVDVLASPELPAGEGIESGRLNAVLEFARSLYDWIVIDAPVAFHRASLMAISECDVAYLITTPDLASLHLTRRATKFLSDLAFDKSRCRIVVNRLSRRESIERADIEKIFGSSIHACIPNEYFTLHRAISLGQPVGADCELGRSIANLAAQFSAGSGAVSESKKKEPVPARA